MLSGWPGRLAASVLTVPACGPVSQYFDSRRPIVSANTSADPSAVGVTPLAKYSPGTMVNTVPSGSRRNRLPRGRASSTAPLKCVWVKRSSTR
jgi:hypothetical protein